MPRLLLPVFGLMVLLAAACISEAHDNRGVMACTCTPGWTGNVCSDRAFSFGQELALESVIRSMVWDYVHGGYKTSEATCYSIQGLPFLNHLQTAHLRLLVLGELGVTVHDPTLPTTPKCEPAWCCATNSFSSDEWRAALALVRVNLRGKAGFFHPTCSSEDMCVLLPEHHRGCAESKYNSKWSHCEDDDTGFLPYE